MGTLVCRLDPTQHSSTQIPDPQAPGGLLESLDCGTHLFFGTATGRWLHGCATEEAHRGLERFSNGLPNVDKIGKVWISLVQFRTLGARYYFRLARWLSQTLEGQQSLCLEQLTLK